ncbi:HYR domain-containing protein [Antarcticibacterium sp. 1MA-6-2]|uniref:HYR domain-containing protein n=1 Tax=Antarcticibacterium sp. 1MA-6-2 TaxID=2908210 RepID=UPI001F2609BC|nr:HYR domain-containing protein [Antarcticibacterium sp. 1MA-6-2]UJH91195.1 HYR domain-containing protein [Antarcticibacterium sp. 1MA-6-2]
MARALEIFFEVGTTIVTFEATGSDGNTVQCDFTVIVIDNENPVFYSCPSDVTLTAPVGQTSAAVNYSAPTARDNCGEPTITTSGPVSGSQFPVGTTTVTFTATDASGGTATCSFKVTVEPNDIPLEITCPQPQNRSKNENCEAVVPDFTGEVTANKEATFSQSPPAGSIISEATTITITATAGNEAKQCSFLLTITDNSPPSFSCPEDQTKAYDPATGFALPDYRDQINATDNCGIKSIVQDPPPGTVIHDDQLVMLYVWDTSDMLSNCSFTVTLSEEEVLDITCPTDQQAELGDNCSFVVPDYRANA